MSNTSTKRVPPKEVARGLLWERGTLYWKLWNNIQKKIEAKFRDCIARKTGILFVNCTRGGGKTFWGVNKTFEYLRHPLIKKPQIFLATAYETDLYTIITPTFESLAEDKPPELDIKHLAQRKMYYDVQTKGKAYYRGLDRNKNSLRGNYADLVIIEECQNVRNLSYQWNYVVKQLFRHRPFPICVFIGTPPETPDHDWVEIMEMAKLRDAYVEATIDEHDKMSDEEKAFMMKDISETAILREYYCKIVVDSTRAIVPEWDEKKHEKAIVRDEFYHFYHKYIFMDLGVVDLTAVVFGFYDFREATFKAEREFVMNGPEMTTEKLAEQLIKTATELWGTEAVKATLAEAVLQYENDWIDHDTYIQRLREVAKTLNIEVRWRGISDNDNPLLLQDLSSDYNLHFTTAKKDKRNAMVNKLRIWVRNGQIQSEPSNRYLNGSFRTGIWDDKRKEFDRSKIYGHYDPISAIMYGIRAIDVHTNPIPPEYGASIYTHFVTEKKREPEGVRELKKAFKVNR